MDGACGAAGNYAADNRARAIGCDAANDRYAVQIETLRTVGKSVVKGTEDLHATAKATAVIEPRCAVGDKVVGNAIVFTCDGEELTVDPTADNFKLHLAEFFSVHLSE
jgi:hypothetical protein